MAKSELCDYCKRSHFRGADFTDIRLPKPRPQFHSRECMALYMQAWLNQQEVKANAYKPHNGHTIGRPSAPPDG